MSVDSTFIFTVVFRSIVYYLLYNGINHGDLISISCTTVYTNDSLRHTYLYALRFILTQFNEVVRMVS